MTKNFDDHEISGASINDFRKIREANISPLENSDGDQYGYTFGPVNVQIPTQPETKAVKGSSYYRIPLNGGGAALYTNMQVLKRSRWRSGGEKLSSILGGGDSSHFLRKCLERAISLTVARDGIEVKKKLIFY